MKLGRYDLAAKVARIVITESDWSADAHSLLASALDELGQWHEALPHWQRAAELAPDSPLARFNLALALLRLGDYRPGFPLHEARVARPEWTCRAAGMTGRELYEAPARPNPPAHVRSSRTRLPGRPSGG